MPRRKRYLKIIWGRFLFIRCDFASLSEGLFVYPSARHTLVESIGNAMFGHYFDKSASVTWNSAIWESIQRQVHQQIKWAHLISEHFQTCFSPLPTFFFSFSSFFLFLFSSVLRSCATLSKRIKKIDFMTLKPPSNHHKLVPLSYFFSSHVRLCLSVSRAKPFSDATILCTVYTVLRCCVIPSVRRSVPP